MTSATLTPSIGMSKPGDFAATLPVLSGTTTRVTLPWAWSIARAMRALGIRPTPVPEQALRLASGRGEVRRGDLVARCGISPEAARRALLGLESAGLVRREGSGRGTRYVLAPPTEGVGPVAGSRGARPDRGSPHAPHGP